MTHSSTFFDTRFDTNKYFVAMTINFKKRNYINSEGLSPIFLNVHSKTRKVRLNLDVYVKPDLWDKRDERLKGPAEQVYDTNLILDNIYSKITKIKTTYKLSSKMLTIDSFIDEFNNEMPRANFVSFFNRILTDRKETLHPNTFKKEMAIYNKLNAYKKEILFCDISALFFMNYRNYLANIGNGPTTRNNNIKIIKKYLRVATRIGIRLPIELEDIKSGSTKGDRSFLNPEEVQKCYKYFDSPFINQVQKNILGYFLFSCFTGLRISDVKQIKRQHIVNNAYTLKNVKTGKNQVVNINKKAMHLVNSFPELFVKFYSEKHINETLKVIMTALEINKHVSFHVARHTFATNLIILGLPVTDVKELLNHENIKDTMIYVHLAKQEKNRNADLLDTMF